VSIFLCIVPDASTRDFRCAAVGPKPTSVLLHGVHRFSETAASPIVPKSRNRRAGGGLVFFGSFGSGCRLRVSRSGPSA
jgi:hypothetical protein